MLTIWALERQNRVKGFFDMDTIAQFVGLDVAQLTQLAILTAVLVVGLFVLRTVLKLTAAIFRLGCFGILFIVAAVFILQLLSN